MLVIIGLIVGGVLTGQSLIAAAAVRAQISQIEKYNTAANAFRDKYGCLPGDLSVTLANQFGFIPGGIPRIGVAGYGDCNGIVQGFSPAYDEMADWSLQGETAMFWEDLSAAYMIDGGFNTANPITIPTTPSLLMPQAKIGNGNYVGVTSGGLGADSVVGMPGNGINYFTLIVPAALNFAGNCTTCNPGLTVTQAYNIDAKTDDGMPTTGRVRAMFLGAGAVTYDDPVGWSTNAATPSANTCYDTTSGKYSLTQNNGGGVNCGLSFQFQSGD